MPARSSDTRHVKVATIQIMLDGAAVKSMPEDWLADLLRPQLQRQGGLALVDWRYLPGDEDRIGWTDAVIPADFSEDDAWPPATVVEGSAEIFPGWTAEDAEAATEEGWCLIESSDGQIVVECDSDTAPNNYFTKCREPNVAAHEHVEARAKEDSPLHRRAIAAINLSLARMVDDGQDED